MYRLQAPSRGNRGLSLRFDRDLYEGAKKGVAMKGLLFLIEVHESAYQVRISTLRFIAWPSSVSMSPFVSAEP